MSVTSQIQLTPREVRQTRGLVIAFDFAFWAIVLNYVAIAVPIIILMIRGMTSDGYGTWLATQILPLLFWFSTAATAINVASAFLFLGAPLRMRCFPEAMAFAGLTLLIAVISSVQLFVPLPVLLSYAVTATILFLNPVVLLLLFRKAAIFISSNEDLETGRSIVRLMFIGAMLGEIGATLPKVIGYFNPPAELLPLAVLTPVLPLGAAIVCFALVSLRLFRLQRSLRRKFTFACRERSRGKDSANSLENTPTLDQRADTVTLQSSQGDWGASEVGAVPRRRSGLALLLSLLIAVVVVCEFGNLLIVRAIRSKAEAKQFALSAQGFNAELWEKVRAQSGTSNIDEAAIQRMQSICVRLPRSEYLNTLGVAQYRFGNYGEAKATLERSLNASRSMGHPSDLAFLAMSHHKLGEIEQAQNVRARLTELMKLDRFSNDRESIGFVRELDALFNNIETSQSEK